MKNIPKHHWLVLAGLIAVCFAVAGLGGMATTPNLPDWYAGLNKPSWTPPGWVFGPVWTLLYLSAVRCGAPLFFVGGVSKLSPCREVREP